MAVIDFPAGLGTRFQKLFPMETQAQALSPFTGKRNVTRGFSQWVLQFQPSAVRLAEHERWLAFFMRLRGQLNAFRYFPIQSVVSSLPNKNLPLGGFSFSTTLTIGGWLPNQVSSLRTGQLFSVGGQLYCAVSAPVFSDLTGRCVVEVSPPIIAPLAVNAAVEFIAPFGKFYLPEVEKAIAGFDVDRIGQWPVIDALQDLQQ